MNPLLANSLNRRAFLQNSSYSVGSAALLSLLGQDQATASQWRGTLADKLHYPPKAKRIIHLCMAGGPSHLETLDYKPELAKLSGKGMPTSFTEGQQLAQLQASGLGVHSHRSPE